MMKSSTLVYCLALSLSASSVFAEEKKDATAATSRPAAPAAPESVPGIAATAAEAKPLQPGAKVPAPIKVLNTAGEPVNLAGGEETLVVFFRGGWCPYCNVHLAELSTAIDQFKEKGIRVVAISPDHPEKLKELVADKQIAYELYSDRDLEAMKAYGVAFKVPDATMKNYLEKYQLDLQDRAKGVLPVPSAFLVDKEGVVRFTHANVEIKDRIKAADLLAAAEKLKAE